MPLIRRLLIIVVLLAAAFFRLWDLPATPPGLYNDEGYNGLDALDFWQTGPKLFFEANTGREPLFNHLLALSVGLLGRSSYALRLPAAMLGILTVAAIYALAREMFRRDEDPRSLASSGERIALLAAAFLAVSQWQIDINRLSLRVNTMPLLLSVAFILLWRASRKNGSYLAAGAAFGLVFYTYISARIVPAFALALGVSELVLRPADRAFRSVKAFGRWYGLALLVVAPLAAYYALHPDLFFGRAAYVSVLGPTGGSDRIGALIDSVLGNLAMFGQEGDGNWRHNIPGKPVFDAATYALLLLGLVVCLVRIRRGPYLQLLVWTGVMMLPGFVATDEYPHYTRTMGIVPAVYLFPALGAELLASTVTYITSRLSFIKRQDASRAGLAGISLMGLVLAAGTGIQTYRDYFIQWAHSQDVFYAFDGERTEAARLMLSRADGARYLLPFNFRLASDFRHASTEFLVGDQVDYRWVRVEEASLPAALPGIVAGNSHVVLLSWKGGEIADADPKGLLSFLLGQAGVPDERSESLGLKLTGYRLSDPPPTSLLDSERVVNQPAGDGLLLRGFSFGPDPSDGRFWAVLRWQATGRISTALAVSVQVFGPDGRLFAQQDAPLLSNDLFPSDRWTAGLPALTYLSIDGPPGAPPADYRIRVVLYEQLGGRQVRVFDPLATFRIDGLRRAFDSAWADSPISVTGSSPVRFVGGRTLRPEVRPGEPATVVTFWAVGSDPPGNYQLRLRLRDSSGQVVGEDTFDPVAGRYPTSRWPAGSLVRDVADVSISADATPGRSRIELAWFGSTGVREAGTLAGPVIVDRPRRFDLPAQLTPIGGEFDAGIRLAGWIPELGPGSCATPAAVPCSVRGRLVWQASGRPDRTWTVFVHLTGPDGRPVAQHDGQPAGGDAPTIGWRVGEVVEDPFELRLPAGLAAGEYRLVAGLYDSQGRARLADGGDSVLLGTVQVRR